MLLWNDGSYYTLCLSPGFPFIWGAMNRLKSGTKVQGMMIQMTLQQTSRVFKIVFTQIKYANLLSILFQSISLINVFFLHLGIAFLLLRCLFKSSFSACLPGIIFIFSSHSFKKIFIFTLFCFTILYWFCHILTCSYCSRQLIK